MRERTTNHPLPLSSTNWKQRPKQIQTLLPPMLQHWEFPSLVQWWPMVKRWLWNLSLDCRSPVPSAQPGFWLISKYSTFKYLLGFSSFLWSPRELSWIFGACSRPVLWSSSWARTVQEACLFLLSPTFFLSFLFFHPCLPCGMAGEKGLWCGLTAT